MDNTTQARPGSLENAYDASVTWRHIAPRGVTLEHCREPAYWRNVTREAGMQRVIGRHAWNRIEILAEDGTWEAELRVLSVADGLVHTRTIRAWHADTKPKADAPEGYAVEHIDGNGWRAVDPAGAILAEKKTTRDQALSAAIDHATKARKGGR